MTPWYDTPRKRGVSARCASRIITLSALVASSTRTDRPFAVTTEGQLVDYSRFERLVISIGAVAIMATAVISLYPVPDAIELVAQMLLMAVLVGAVRWGRRGGTYTAVAATMTYILMRIDYGAATNFSPEFTRLLLVRAGTYCLVGIGVGEACSRMKDAFARAKDDMAIDPSSRLYTASFMIRLMRTSLALYLRYGTPFSIVVLEVDTSAASDVRPEKADEIVRAIAGHLRSELRLVDDVGRLRTGAFVILLRQTGRAEAEDAAARLRSGLRDSLGISEGAVHVQALGSADDLAEIEMLIADATA